MPVNFLEIRNQVKEMTHHTLQEQKRLAGVLQRVLEVLVQNANQLDKLGKLVDRAAESDQYLRCARPLNEALDYCQPPPPSIPDVILLAADGSQINPSRHDAVQFGLVNAGAIRMQPGSARAPQEIIRSLLLYSDDLFTRQGPVSEEEVALRRDLFERRLLAELAEEESLPVVALTDGPLELFREPHQSPALKQAFKDFQAALARLATQKVITAGYVDKPRSDLLVHLLELVEMDDAPQPAAPHPFHGISDRDVLKKLLQPGQRSGIFAIHSPSACDYEADLAPFFFYLNVGLADRPHPVRIEIPAWMAKEKERLDILQATLLAQCRPTGARPYPYILHRAHEVAVVSLQEKEKLQDMVQMELRSQGADLDEKSHKQNLKDTHGKRTRYK